MGKKSLLKNLIYAAMNDNLEEIKEILQESVRYKRNREGELIQRVDINGRNEYGETALYQAAYNGHYNSVKYLLDLGADPNIVNKVYFYNHGGLLMNL